MNDGSRLRHAVGRSKSAALKDLLSASCLPILIRLRSSKLGSGGLGIWATILAMSDEKASDTCSLRSATASKYLQLCFWAKASASAAVTCGSPSALFPTTTRGSPGLAASTCEEHV
eukprot:Transcript_21804.p3 GENE.Transcript_21804~~Transcript_21804.p3  ORF type:complete len:116 (+),score=11.49 Transcript_21804:97-444(+)